VTVSPTTTAKSVTTAIQTLVMAAIHRASPSFAAMASLITTAKRAMMAALPTAMAAQPPVRWRVDIHVKQEVITTVVNAATA